MCAKNTKTNSLKKMERIWKLRMESICFGEVSCRFEFSPSWSWQEILHQARTLILLKSGCDERYCPRDENIHILYIYIDILYIYMYRDLYTCIITADHLCRTMKRPRPLCLPQTSFSRTSPNTRPGVPMRM